MVFSIIGIPSYEVKTRKEYNEKMVFISEKSRF